MTTIKFEPWNDYIDSAFKITEIKEPPCKYCKYFDPRIVTDSRGNFDGVCLCISENMCSDFSCFRNKEDE